MSEQKDVPYIVHEGDMARQERTINRLWVTSLVAIILLVATNGAWIWYESQWQVVETTTTTQKVKQDSESGSNTFTGGDYYGETDGQNNIDNNENQSE